MATIPTKAGGAVRVSLDANKGLTVVDVRNFEAFTPAGAMFPTGKAFRVEPGAIADLIRALRKAAAAASESALSPA